MTEGQSNMGTNYYAFTGKKVKVTCDCGFEHYLPEKLHIGKNSYGWYFSLQVIFEKGLMELEDWRTVLKKSRIVDEYGEEISYDEMIKTILKNDNSDRKMTKESKDSMKLEAKMRNYHLDTENWLFYIDRKGKEGNYALVLEDFS